MVDMNKFHNEERDAACKSVLHKHRFGNLSSYGGIRPNLNPDYRQGSMEMKFDLS